MIILGINAFHGDSSACIVRDGKIIIAIEEERLRRVKHWAGFPENAIKKCLEFSNLSFPDLDYISINRDPNANIKDKIIFTINNRPDFKNVLDRVKNRMAWGDISQELENVLGAKKSKIDRKIDRVEHHVAHLASAFYPSPFEQAVCLSIDGFGDFISTLWGYGNGLKIEKGDNVKFPHSLGILYTAITQFLGFWNYGDEYKVMGMAAWGSPKYKDKIRKLISLTKDGKFELNTVYFQHTAEGVSMEWEGGYPKLGQIFNDQIIDLFGEFRKPDDEFSDYQKDLAASLQFVFEEVFFHILNHLNSIYPDTKKLVMAGGVAQSSVAVGKITSRTKFDEVWVQPAAGDAGGALGAALHTYVSKEKQKPAVMTSASLGIGYKKNEIDSAVSKIDSNHKISKFNKIKDLDIQVAGLLCEGKVIGYFQGRFEWGPRALGNRSIIVDPRIKDMKKLLNEKIKKRESFRPFAPSVMEEHVSDWFEKDEKVPFMTHVFNIIEDKREKIPAITHVDGTGRLQTVNKNNNGRYYTLIHHFYKKTGIPMILNTSFNENEPIVNSPKEAIDCYLRTSMDCLVLENYLIERK